VGPAAAIGDKYGRATHVKRKLTHSFKAPGGKPQPDV
jgi:hypothetical protein